MKASSAAKRDSRPARRRPCSHASVTTRVELVVAQVGRDRHALEPRLARLAAASVASSKLTYSDTRRAVAALQQGVGLHHVVGQHGDLVARHVDRRQALARDLVERRCRARCARPGAAMWMPTRHRAACPGPAPTARRRSRWCSSRRSRTPATAGQRQVVLDRRRGERREAGALGEVLEQEAPPVELVGRVDRAGRLAAGPAARVCVRARGLDHRLVLGRVLVGLEQDLVELLADRRRAAAARPVRRPRRRSAPATCFFFSMREPAPAARFPRAPCGSGPCRARRK